MTATAPRPNRRRRPRWPGDVPDSMTPRPTDFERRVGGRGGRDVDQAGARLLAAADRERRRLERDLHDGAQQRLVSLSVQLRLLASRLAPGSEAEQLLADARNELAAALQELRDLARGIHPAILRDRGLPAALEALTARAPLPVELLVEPGGRPPEPVELAAYYLVSEALTNILKHSDATTAGVSVARRGTRLVVEVIDDGAGGADRATGSGLRGLTDRMEALGGQLEVSSPPGAGTTLRAEIPLEPGHPSTVTGRGAARQR